MTTQILGDKGLNGIEVPRLALGCMRMEERSVKEVSRS